MATNTYQNTLIDSISQLITQKVVVNKKTPNCYDSLYLSNFDQREIKHTPGTKSDKKDDDSVQTLTHNTPKETPQSPVQSETPYYKMSNKFLNP